MKYRIDPQYSINFDDLVVDNFAGGGGASTGIEAALGRPVDIAINHDPDAIAMHAINHPLTHHFCESVWDIDPVKVCGGRPVGLAWFSPDCKHFSKAKGGKPVEKKIRGLAWVVIRWAKKVKPRVIMLENVEEFKTWGPLDADNMPCPVRKGETFAHWKRQLVRLGYQVEHRELRACDYGAPTIRKRLFIVARCDGAPIVWPDPTHGPGLIPYRTAADIIDWSIPVQSIFERKRPLAENTLRRIARGLQRFVIDNPDPFIVRIGQTGFGGDRLQYSLDQPLTTVTSKAEHCLVTPIISTYYGSKSQSDVRGQKLSDPLATQPTENRHALVTAFLAKHFGGATGVEIDTPLPTTTMRGTQNQIVTANLVRHFGQSVGSDAREPIGTVTPGGLGKTGLVTSNLLKLRGTCKDGQDVREPLPTITAGGFHVGEVRAFLLKYYGTNIGHGCAEPLQTVTSKHRFGLVTIKGEDYQIIDICMRMLEPRELFRAQGFGEDYIIDRDATGKKITKTAQVARCGNSVCPPVAEALVRANVVEVGQSEAACA
ncbi:DNA cytosine methyltransferase [Geopsychrobacter electrodiphilus]|uniref:DNA cytosine methyltransferase n=1 Tax=Geopsychrobacter electrodiphilus TaxID=225196 RepID=UPI000368CB04|nr:DNA cytosine methyltransferase [Geopsychrobacter electrodiphilus]